MFNRQAGGPFESWCRKELLFQLSAKGKLELKKKEADNLYVRAVLYSLPCCRIYQKRASAGFCRHVVDSSDRQNQEL